MVRSYLRHEPSQVFGLICSNSNTAKSVFDAYEAIAYVPALEDVIAWDTRKGEIIATWHETGHNAAVTCLARPPSSSAYDNFAVGYADGSIRIWDPSSATALLTLDGHEAAVTALAFNFDGTRLASGSQDTDVIVWDTVAECGMYRLKGHRDAVTDLVFVRREAPPTLSSSTTSHSYLVTSSKDSFIKLWDLSLQHCVDTAVSAHGQVWTLALLVDPVKSSEPSRERFAAKTLIVSGSSEGDVSLWEISWEALDRICPAVRRPLVPCGSLRLPTGGSSKITQIAFNNASSPRTSQARLMAVVGSDKVVHIYRLRSVLETEKKLARRKRRAKEIAERKGTPLTIDINDARQTATWQDRLEFHTVLRPAGGRLRSIAFSSAADAMTSGDAEDVLLLCTLASNQLEVHRIPTDKSPDPSDDHESSLASVLDLLGHRAEVRAIAVSPDDNLLASACSSGTLKVWNIKTSQCVRTFPCGYALCITWLADNRHVIVGCKDGSLRSYDIAAARSLETISAHDGPLWSIAVQPINGVFVTASADHSVKFWEVEMQSTESGSSQPAHPPQIKLIHKRTLKMTDDVLSACYSPDGKLLAISLLDCTVKVFYADSLKFFLSLYGHKLPVLALDISSDSKLCITVSADKNVKIWGLDFGDCHKSIFAHSDSVVACRFERGSQGGGLMGGREGASHHFWTAGKDGMVKHWDGDRFELIQTLKGHHGSVWALAVDSEGSFVVSAGADRSLRTWIKTDEPLFLEEERERELEQLYSGTSRRQDDQLPIGTLADGAASERFTKSDLEATSVTKVSEGNLLAGERLIEAIELADTHRPYQELSVTQAPHHSAVLVAAFEGSGEQPTAEKYVLKCLERIPAAQLEDALLVLPFEKVISLLVYIDYFASQNWAVSLVTQIFLSLIQTHNAQLVANQIMRSTLRSLRSHLRKALQLQRANYLGLQCSRTANRSQQFSRGPNNRSCARDFISFVRRRGGSSA